MAEEVKNVLSLGVKIETNVIIGKSTTIDELLKEEGFEAVFIGSGADFPCLWVFREKMPTACSLPMNT